MPALAMTTELRAKSAIPAPGMAKPTTSSRMAGIAWGRSDAFLDEHPDAYKPVERVMADSADLVEIRHTLHQVVNVKGN